MTFKAVGLLDGTGGVRVKTKTGIFRFDGTVGIGPLQLGSAYLQVDPAGSAQFGGSMGYDFGPVSMNATLAGWVDSGGQFAVSGGGTTCLFVCLNTQALLSSVGLAACGELDLFFTSVSAGFGYRYKTKSLDVFVNSCDLSPYAPPAPKAQILKAGDLQPSQSATVQVTSKTQDVFALAIQAVAGATSAPRVTVKGPPGDPRVAQMPAAEGEFGFLAPPPGKRGTILVDPNPLASTTTVMIARPGVGAWTITADEASAPIAKIETSRELPPVTKAAVKGSVSGKVGKKSVAKVVASAKKQAAPTAKTVGGLKSLPAFARKRAKAFKYDLGATGGSVTFVARGPGGAKVLGTVPPEKAGSFYFDPPQGGGTHEVVAFIRRPDGMPRVLRTVATYKPPADAKPGKPNVKALSRLGSRLAVLVDHGPAQASKKNALAFVAMVTGADGSRRTELVRTKDLKKAKGGWRFLVNDAPRSKVKVAVRGVWRGRSSTPGSRSLARKGPALKHLS